MMVYALSPLATIQRHLLNEFGDGANDRKVRVAAERLLATLNNCGYYLISENTARLARDAVEDRLDDFDIVDWRTVFDELDAAAGEVAG